MISDAISVVGGRHTDRGLSSPPTTRIVVLLASGAEAPRSVGEGAPFVIGRASSVLGGMRTDRGLSSPPTTRIVVLLASGAEAPRSVGGRGSVCDWPGEFGIRWDAHGPRTF